jgi:yecA family protein
VLVLLVEKLMIDVSDLMARVDKALEQFDQEMLSSECHGWLVGLICARGDFGWKEWSAMLVQAVNSDDLLAREALSVLEGLYEETQKQLCDSSLDFHPLLPDDETDIEERIRALGEWCQGFLYGLSEGGIKELDKLPEDSAEVIQDLVEIGSAEGYELEGSDEDEASYAELLEYVRTGVLLVNEEMNPSQAPPQEDVTYH